MEGCPYGGKSQISATCFLFGDMMTVPWVRTPRSNNSPQRPLSTHAIYPSVSAVMMLAHSELISYCFVVSTLYRTTDP